MIFFFFYNIKLYLSQNNDGVLLTISIIYLFDIFYKGSTAFLLLLLELLVVLFIDLFYLEYLVGVV